MEETSVSVTTGVVAELDIDDADIRTFFLEPAACMPTRATFGLYTDSSEVSKTFNFVASILVPEWAPPITAFPAIPTRAVTGFVVLVPRALTLAREFDVVVPVLFTTVFVRAVRAVVAREAVRAVVPRDVPVADRDEADDARDVVLARALFVDDVVRDTERPLTVR